MRAGTLQFCRMELPGSADTPQSMTKVYTRSSPDAFGETISIDVGNGDNAYEFKSY